MSSKNNEVLSESSDIRVFILTLLSIMFFLTLLNVALRLFIILILVLDLFLMLYIDFIISQSVTGFIIINISAFSRSVSGVSFLL